MRQAASAWESGFSDELAAAGMKKGTFAPTILWDESRSMRCAAHGGDFTILGWHGDLMDMVNHLRSHCGLKVRGTLGDDSHDDIEVPVLNRIVRWTSKGIESRGRPEARPAGLRAPGVDREVEGP